MKQNRALSALLSGNLAREKRLGLAALALLFVSVGLLVLSQRPWRQPSAPTPTLPGAGAGTLPSTNPGTATPPTTTPNSSEQPAPVAVAPATLAYPLDGDVRITQSYHSIDSAYGDMRYFDAVAWEASPGQAVRAAAKGRVLQVSGSPGEGMQIWVDHGGGMITRYTGLAVTLVAEGAEVNAKQVIGEVGPPTELRSKAGPHLTFAVTLNGASVDPNLYLRK